MLSLGRLVAAPAVAVLLFLGSLSILGAAAAAGPLATLIGVGGGVFFYLGAIAMAYLVWLKRVNAEIDADRRGARRDLKVDDEK